MLLIKRPADGETLPTSAEVAEYSEDVLMKWVEKLNINADDIQSSEELRSLVQLHIHKADDLTLSEDDDIHSTKHLVASILMKDKAARQGLKYQYEAIKKFYEINGEGTKLTERFPNLETTLDSHMNDLNDKECPIVVAGEVSAGKSSLINLLLGESIFPTAHLACTSTICRLHNAERKALEVSLASGQQETHDDLNEIHQLQEHMKEYAVAREGDEKACRQLDIYWPVRYLPENVIIVDIPGIGESAEMNQLVFDYLKNAIVCIYVLNSANAGGVQEDKLKMILRERIETTKDLLSLEHAFDNTLFVCNYWDVVEECKQKGDVADVEMDIKEKLREVIPNLDESMVVKMSVKETSRRLKLRLGKTDMFITLLQRFQTLMQGSLTAKSLRHVRIQQKLLQDIQRFFKLSEILRDGELQSTGRKIHEGMEAIKDIMKETEEISEDIKRTTRQELLEVAEALYSHFCDDSTKKRFIDCRNLVLPTGTEFVLRIIVEKLFMRRFEESVISWETQNQKFAMVSERVMEELRNSTLKISKRLRDVDRKLDIPEFEAELPFDLSAIDGHVRLWNRPFIIDAAFVSVVAAAFVSIFTVFALPIFAVVAGISGYLLYKRFLNADQYQVHLYVKYLYENNLTKEMLKDYVDQGFYARLATQIDNTLQDNVIEKIETRKLEFKIISEVGGHSKEILSAIQNSQPCLDKILSRGMEIQLHSEENISKSRLRLGERFGGGQFSDVFRAEVDAEQVALKLSKWQIRPDNIKDHVQQLKIARSVQHENIVRCVGMHLHRDKPGETTTDAAESTEDEPSVKISVIGSRMALAFELCDESLEHRVFTTYVIRDRLTTDDTRKEALQFLQRTIEGICSALGFLHERGYIHRNLKLSKVLIKDNIPKLGGCEQSTISHRNFTGSSMYMSPEMLNQHEYTSSTDIYSLGILLWEMWYGRPAFTEDVYKNMSIATFIEKVDSGLRPSFRSEGPMPERLQQLVEDCWDRESTNRPRAVVVSGKVKFIVLDCC